MKWGHFRIFLLLSVLKKNEKKTYDDPILKKFSFDHSFILVTLPHLINSVKELIFFVVKLKTLNKEPVQNIGRSLLE